MQQSIAVKYIILALLTQQSTASNRPGWRIPQEITFLNYRPFTYVAVLCGFHFVLSHLSVTFLAWFPLRGLPKLILVKPLDTQSTPHHISICDAV